LRTDHKASYTVGNFENAAIFNNAESIPRLVEIAANIDERLLPIMQQQDEFWEKHAAYLSR
jgi:hypothetical protein